MKAAEATRRKRFVIEHSRGKFTCGKQPLFQIWSQMVRNLATFGESAGAPARQNVRFARGYAAYRVAMITS